MPNYVDGFVIPIPRKKLPAYRRMAAKAKKVWADHGALDYKECVGDDLRAEFGLPFPKGIRSKPGEAIVFSYIVFKSRKHRDRVNAAVMKDPRLAEMCNPEAMPFDCRRMMYGGFQVFVG